MNDKAPLRQQRSVPPLDRSVREVMAPPLVVGPDHLVDQVAQMMTESGSSAAIVVDDDRATGIVTDSDLRSRYVAKTPASGLPIRAIMTHGLHALAPDDTVADALSIMASRDVHHVPVMEGAKPIGCVYVRRLLATVAGNPLQLIGSATAATSVAELQDAYRQLPGAVVPMITAGSGGLAVVRLLSLFAEHSVTKAVAWATDELGPPPAEYALIALGSLARREQTLVTDQDHALVIEDGAGDHPWFAKFGEHVTATLEAVGLKRCPGDVMISSPDWRDEQRQWRKRWAAFVSKPEPKHILASNIVMDVRQIAGTESLVEPFTTMIDLARKSPTFVLFLANSARDKGTPLGPFSRWKLERKGPHAGAFDIKKGAILPTVQIARVLGLVAGSTAIETVARLYDAAEAGAISADSADILANGYELATSVRLGEQAARWRSGRELDNWVRPADLSAWQRAGLREVLKTIRVSQDAISLSYQGAYVP